ncbi:MAG TPA: hypothetical protein VIX91_14985 [Candidatus Acidoferrum sp.]
MPGVVAMFFGGWALTYPSPDPKSIKYVLWKADLYKLNLDEATGTMVGDRHRDKLVVGKTKAQLRDKFGSLLSPAGVSAYLRGCYQNSSWKDREVLFIRQSPWMVVFDGDKATNLVLVKGCGEQNSATAETVDLSNGKLHLQVPIRASTKKH